MRPTHSAPRIASFGWFRTLMARVTHASPFGRSTLCLVESSGGILSARNDLLAHLALGFYRFKARRSKVMVQRDCDHTPS